MKEYIISVVTRDEYRFVVKANSEEEALELGEADYYDGAACISNNLFDAEKQSIEVVGVSS